MWAYALWLVCHYLKTSCSQGTSNLQDGCDTYCGLKTQNFQLFAAELENMHCCRIFPQVREGCPAARRPKTVTATMIGSKTPYIFSSSHNFGLISLGKRAPWQYTLACCWALKVQHDLVLSLVLVTLHTCGLTIHNVTLVMLRITSLHLVAYYRSLCGETTR